MKVTSQGNIFLIHSDLMQTHERIPSQVYYVRCEENRGFFLLQRSELEIKENKIYGVHMEKCKKVLDSFEKFERHLGVILSGDKGIGKSLFARLLSYVSIKNGYPVLIIDRPYGGLGDFLESIEQECIVLFDEFDKTFGREGQNDMLSMFDGMSAGKKLFVITCNDLSHLSEFMVNRPGRFHYHFRFEYPGAKEVREYLEDKLPERYHSQIQDVVVFSRKTKLNYDCLRAIAFELSQGLPFDEAIKDLNIADDDYGDYDVCLTYHNGMSISDTSVEMYLFSKYKKIQAELYDKFSHHIASVAFLSGDVIWDEELEALTVPVEKLQIKTESLEEKREIRRRSRGMDCYEMDDYCEALAQYSGLIPEKFTIVPSQKSSSNYDEW